MPNVYLLALLILLVSCRKETQIKSGPILRPVQVVKVGSLGTIDKSYSGTVEAEEFSILAFKISGSLVYFPVSEGQIVPRSYIIARMDPDDYRLKYQTAQANYSTAQAIYERTQRLLEQNATAVQNFEIARADYIRASSALDIASRTLGYTELRAPFRGLIEKKYVENYQEILTGDPIVKLVNPEKLNVRFILPETSIQLIDIPKTIYVQFDTRPGKWFKAGIKEYVYSSDGSGIPVTLRIDDPEFAPFREEVYPGFAAKVLFKIENTISDNFIIPASALFTHEDKYYLWIVDPLSMTVYPQPIDIIRFEDKALVKKGLNKDDIIVTAGVNQLKNGQKVSIQNNNNL